MHQMESVLPVDPLAHPHYDFCINSTNKTCHAMWFNSTWLSSDRFVIILDWRIPQNIINDRGLSVCWKNSIRSMLIHQRVISLSYIPMVSEIKHVVFSVLNVDPSPDFSSQISHRVKTPKYLRTCLSSYLIIYNSYIHIISYHVIMYIYNIMICM